MKEANEVLVILDKKDNKAVEFANAVKNNPDMINRNTKNSIGNQNKHFKGTKEYEQCLRAGYNKSYFDDSKITPTELSDYVLDHLNKIDWKITGDGFIGYLEFKDDIAYNVDAKSKVEEPTNRIKIYFSTKGFHCSPTVKKG